MKTELEDIHFDEKSSIRLMVNPSLSDFFFWHFHPEYELVFIDGANGTRHVGEHISRFMGSDLVLIGSNIPHLNFDYGIKSTYEKIVVHIKPDFLERALQTIPELNSIKTLFELSRHGIAFDDQTKALVSDQLKKLHRLTHFERFIELIRIFDTFSTSSQKTLLH